MTDDHKSSMPNQGTIDKKSPRTVEQWREYLDVDAKKKRGAWKTLTREMHNSRAFAELDRAGILVVLAMLDKLNERPKERRPKDRKNVETAYQFQNDGRFVIVQNELKARGLKSSGAIASGKRQAWELGFFDVIRTGTVARAGEYRYSDRWRRFPDGDYLPHGQQEPGACLYYRFPKKEDATHSEKCT